MPLSRSSRGLDDNGFARNLSADDVEAAVELGYLCPCHYNLDSQAGCEATAVLLDFNYDFLTPLTPPPIVPCKAKIKNFSRDALERISRTTVAKVLVKGGSQPRREWLNGVEEEGAPL